LENLGKNPALSKTFQDVWEPRINASFIASKNVPVFGEVKIEDAAVALMVRRLHRIPHPHTL